MAGLRNHPESLDHLGSVQLRERRGDLGLTSPAEDATVQDRDGSGSAQVSVSVTSGEGRRDFASNMHGPVET